MITSDHLLKEAIQRPLSGGKPMDFATFVEVCGKSPTGLRWKPRHRSHFVSDRSWNHFNRTLSGKPAGYANCDQNGYRSWKMEIKGRPLVVKNVIWEILHGAIPEGMLVDHKNNDSLDNSPDNLRLATRSQNKMNESLRRDNKVRLKGVSKPARGNKWMARIGPSGRRFLGMFHTPEAAHAAYVAAAKEDYGQFHRTA